MKVAIENIKITERIRKEITKIDEFAEDIKRHGLLNPVTVMQIGDGEYRLLAGLRRLKAAQTLGWTEIDVNVVSPADAEAELRIEISENEQREAFTFSEKMDFARMLEEIESAKAKERKSIGGKGGFTEDVDSSPHLQEGTSRDARGEKIGMRGRQYDRAKYIANNASEEVIEQLDRGERAVKPTYDELRAKEKKSVAAKETEAERMAKAEALFSEQDREAIRKNREFDAMSPADKITELQRQLKAERARAATAESELAREKELHHNTAYHKESTITNLQIQIEELSKALEAAEAKLRELDHDLG
jgi:ParB family chromosome partitioning protein